MSEEFQTIFLNCDEDDARYTKIRNSILEDKNISWKAKGILAYLLSHKKNWTIILSEISKHATDGITSLYSGIKELKNAGYVVHAVVKNNKTQKIIKHIYMSYGKPCFHPKKPDLGFLHMEKPYMENLSITIINNNKTNNKQMTDNIILKNNITVMHATNVDVRDNCKLDNIDKPNNSTKVNKHNKSKTQHNTLLPNIKKTWTERYGNGLKVKLNLNNYKAQSYIKQLRDLRKQGISREQIIEVFDFYFEHKSDKFVPKIYSTKDIAEKFPRIKDAMVRYYKQTNDERYDAFDDSSNECEVYHEPIYIPSPNNPGKVTRITYGHPKYNYYYKKQSGVEL